MYIYTYIRISTYCLKKKKNVLLIKNVISVFHTIFKLDFMKQFISCIIHTCLYILFHAFQTGHSKNTNPSLFIRVAKVQQNDRKKNPKGVRVLNM